MATPSADEASVTRTYRVALRLGEDYITLEETICLPIDASDAEVQQAVDLGWRVYHAQREAVEQQVSSIREAHGSYAAITVRDPDAPASEKQRNYIATLQDHLHWTSDELASYAAEHGVNLVTLTKGQASAFIDELKQLAEERARPVGEARARPVGEAPSASSSAQPASEKQLQALARLAQARALDLDAETDQRYGVRSADLSDEQARMLLSEWQVRPTRSASGRSDPAR